MLNADIGECSANWYMPDMNIMPLVAVHPAPAFRAEQFFFWHLELAFEPEDLPFGFGHMLSRFTIVDEARQEGRKVYGDSSSRIQQMIVLQWQFGYNRS